MKKNGAIGSGKDMVLLSDCPKSISFSVLLLVQPTPPLDSKGRHSSIS